MGRKYYLDPTTGDKIYIRDKAPSLSAYRKKADQDVIDATKVDKITGKGLSTNDYDAAAKAKVDAIPSNPVYTDTIYDDTEITNSINNRPTFNETSDISRDISLLEVDKLLVRETTQLTHESEEVFVIDESPKDFIIGGVELSEVVLQARYIEVEEQISSNSTSVYTFTVEDTYADNLNGNYGKLYRKPNGDSIGFYIKQNSSTNVPEVHIVFNVNNTPVTYLSVEAHSNTFLINDEFISDNIAKQSDLEEKYNKPSTGIPETDLSESVKTKLNYTYDDTKLIDYYKIYLHSTESNGYFNINESAGYNYRTVSYNGDIQLIKNAVCAYVLIDYGSSYINYKLSNITASSGAMEFADDENHKIKLVISSSSNSITLEPYIDNSNPYTIAQIYLETIPTLKNDIIKNNIIRTTNLDSILPQKKTQLSCNGNNVFSISNENDSSIDFIVGENDLARTIKDVISIDLKLTYSNTTTDFILNKAFESQYGQYLYFNSTYDDVGIIFHIVYGPTNKVHMYPHFKYSNYTLSDVNIAVYDSVLSEATIPESIARKSDIPEVYDDTEIKSDLSQKVDKIEGKGLSTNDYDNSAKAKVDAIPNDPKYTDTVYDDTSIRNDLGSIIAQHEERIESLDETELATGQVVETVGIPKYISVDMLPDYENYGLTKTGWYVFAKIKAETGVSITNGFSIDGVEGYITPEIGSNHINVAILFVTASESCKVVINWGIITETFVFKSTDLAVRNLDYRVTYYIYDMKDYTEWTYELTTDTEFVANKKYYTISDGEYILAEVTVGETVSENTYYNHKSVTFRGFARNVSYSSDEIDCPVIIYLPRIDETGYGAWFEIQMVFTGSYSVTFVPPDGAKLSSTTVDVPKEGINILNVQYHERTKTWFITNSIWNL